MNFNDGSSVAYAVHNQMYTFGKRNNLYLFLI